MSIDSGVHMRRLLVLLTMVALLPLTITQGATARSTEETTTTPRARALHLVKKYGDLADIICEKKRAAHHKPGPCKRVLTLRTSYRFRQPDPARLSQQNEFWCKDWSAVARGIYYVNWKEETKGRYCWVEGPRFPEIYRNNWRCGYSSAIGYDVQVEDCWDERRAGDTTAGWWISVYDKFRVTAAFRGFPFHWTHQFHVNLHPTGVITLKNDD